MTIPREVREISSGVYWVGVRDWERKFFDKLVPLPEGTTYNSYLIQGTDKTALVDTVIPGFEEDLETKVEQVMDPRDLDYLIMNHAEPSRERLESHAVAGRRRGNTGYEKGERYGTLPLRFAEGEIPRGRRGR